jgi:DNA repair protein RecO (recombination protein O)
MRIQTRAIILHATKYSETSLIVRAYTEQSGITSFIVGGVRGNGKKRFAAGLFQPLTLVELVASGKPGSSLPRITDIQLSPPLAMLHHDLIKGSIALFLSEVLNRSIKEEEPSTSLFAFLQNAVLMLDAEGRGVSRFHISFMVQLSRWLGFYPSGSYQKDTPFFDLQEGIFTNLKPNHAYYLEQQDAMALWLLMQTPFEQLSTICNGLIDNRRMLQLMVRYYELHVTQGRSILSHHVLSEVMA